MITQTAEEVVSAFDKGELAQMVLDLQLCNQQLLATIQIMEEHSQVANDLLTRH